MSTNSRATADVSWISNSGEADTFLVSPGNPAQLTNQVFANVDPSKGYKGITCFIMSKDQGVEIAKKESKVCSFDMRETLKVQLGIRASSTCVLSLDDVRLPAENIVGEIGKGYKVSHSTYTD